MRLWELNASNQKKRHIVEDKVDEEMVTSIGSGVESSSLMLLLQVMARINIVNHSCFPDFWSSHLIALLIAATLELELSFFSFLTYLKCEKGAKAEL